MFNMYEMEQVGDAQRQKLQAEADKFRLIGMTLAQRQKFPKVIALSYSTLVMVLSAKLKIGIAI